jgi:hypothetical protein
MEKILDENWDKKKNVGTKNVNGASDVLVNRDPNEFLKKKFTVDETWVNHYDTSQNAKVWNGGTKAHCPLEISRHHFNQHGNSFLGS